MAISKDITIEELTERLPASVSWLSKKGIRCIMCGEPVWGTLEEAAKEKGFTGEQIEDLVLELNKMEQEKEELPRQKITGADPLNSGEQ